MYVGESIKRREDEKYLTGAGQFVDDIRLTEDIAHAALFFADPASGWITGETLSVDGGRS